MKFLKFFAAMAWVLALSGCQVMKGWHSSVDGEQTDGQVAFPKVERAKFSTHNYKGSWINWDNVRQLEHGMTKDQLYPLLGVPHYYEGLYGVRQWNYVFNYRDDQDEHRVCQLQIQFDKQMLVQDLHWSSDDCKALSSKRVSLPVVAPLVVQEIVPALPSQNQVTLPDMPTSVPTETFVLGADALFDFDRFDLRAVSSQDRQKLDDMAQIIQRYEEQHQRVQVLVIGHTDILGDEAYNLELSQKRADAVVAYFLSKGVKPISLRALGAGESNQIKLCPESNRQERIACLQPNRRVVIQIYTS